MLGYVYGKDQKLNKSQDLGVKVATPVGTLVGQVLFGWLADVVGRKRMCKSFHSLSDVICISLIFFSDGVELMIMIVATFGQAVSGNAPAVHILGVLIVWRFIVSYPFNNTSHLVSNPRVDGRWNRWRLPSISRHFI